MFRFSLKLFDECFGLMKLCFGFLLNNNHEKNRDEITQFTNPIWVNKIQNVSDRLNHTC